MTLQEAKDQIAVKNGFKDWRDWESQAYEMTGYFNIPDGFHNVAAELYARSKWDEAWEEAVSDALRKAPGSYYPRNKPEFKP